MVGKKKKIEVIGGGGEDGDVIKTLMASINKKVKGSACILSAGEKLRVKDYVSTGCTVLDCIIGNTEKSGFPIGKISMISGEPSSGKSLLCYSLIAEIQKQGGIAALIDTERSIDLDFLVRQDVQTDKLLYSQPETMEEALETIEAIIDNVTASGNKGKTLICFDSLAATPTTEELETGGFDPKKTIASKARCLSSGLPKINEKIDQSSVALVMTNQLRMKLNTSMFEDPFTTMGGGSPKFYSTIMVRLYKGKLIKDAQGLGIGILARAKIEKSRISPPFRQCTYEMSFAKGMENWKTAYRFLLDCEVISKHHGWRSIVGHKGEEKRFQESDWDDMESDGEFKGFIYSLIENKLIIRYKE